MTIESMHFIDTNPENELSYPEQLALRKIDLHHEIGKLCMDLSRLNQELNNKILESIDLNHALAAAGVDKEAIARLLHKPMSEEQI